MTRWAGSVQAPAGQLCELHMECHPEEEAQDPRGHPSVDGPRLSTSLSFSGDLGPPSITCEMAGQSALWQGSQ